ncbi:hypothetical protein JZU69_01945 [bacterium]|nr:hypothetical protein [bacterium]
MFVGDSAFADLTTRDAAAFEKDKVQYRQNNLGQFDVLMGVIRLKFAEFDAAAGTGAGMHRLCFGGLQQRLAVSLVPLASSGLALGRLGFDFPILFEKRGVC